MQARAITVVSMFAVMTACSSKQSGSSGYGGGTGGADGGGASGSGGLAGSAGASSGSGGTGANPGAFGGITTAGEGVCPGSARPMNDGFCHADGCGSTPDCQLTDRRPVDACCVPLALPGAGTNPLLRRTTDTLYFSDPSGAPPELTCFLPANYPTVPVGGSSRTVDMTGVVKSFASGCDLVNVRVEVFTVQRTGDPASDGLPGQLVGTPIVTDSSFPVEFEDVERCNDPRLNRVYTYSDLPMYTELLIKTSSATASAGWIDLYTYDVFITDDAPGYSAASGVYQRDIEALAQDDFQIIPVVAVGNTTRPGNGFIKGEIHDCGDIRLQNASVDIDLERLQLLYFDDNETNPLPDQAHTQFRATGRTALYGAIDVALDGQPSRPARVSAAGLVPSTDGPVLVSLGYYDVRVFANAATNLTLRGVRAWQL